MANVRSTATHTYSTDDCLGLGATCEVYKGISKSGEIRALKVFGPRADNDIGREIKALKELNHRNIIKYFGCEEEVGSRRLVVITEYCDGGSLLDYLQKPEFAYGLDEDEFLLFLKHIVAGMKHYRAKGFVHRDIKPANILRSISEDGSSLYKLSDFGTAKTLSNNENFTSLVGTEEYLHPDIFKAAFVERGQERNFSHTVDLWSLGASLYHCATGRVPFRPHSGRADKFTMFEMIGKKPSGVISGIQTQHRGEIKWASDLPTTCPLSGSLKRRLTAMILKLMEASPQNLWTYEEFFEVADDMLNKEVVIFLVPNSIVNPFCYLYMNQSQNFRDTQQELMRQTKIKVPEQTIMHEEVILTEKLKADDRICELPNTSTEEPLILLPGRSRPDPTGEVDPVLAEIEETKPKFGQQVNYDTDFRSAKKLVEQVALMYRQSNVTSLSQRHYISVRRRLRRKQDDRENIIRSKHRHMSDIFEHVQDLAQNTFQKSDPSHAGDKINKITSELDSCASCMGTQYTVSDDVSLEAHAWCFENSSCKKKFKRWLERAKDILPHFYDRKKKRMASRLDERVHTLEKSELQHIHLKAREHWAEHCIPKNKFLQDSYHQWATNYYDTEDRLQTADDKLEQTKTLLSDLSKQITEAQKSQAASMESSHTQSVRRHNSAQSIDKSVRQQIHVTQEMKALVIDFKEQSCTVFEGLEDPVVFDLPADG